MNKSIIAAVIAVLLGAPVVWAADQPASAAQQTAPGVTGTAPAADNPNANPTANPTLSNTQGIQAPPANWTSLKGTVQSVDATAKTVQLKDETGSVVQVPVDRQVSIKKNGKSVTLMQVQAGDSIILAKRNASSQDMPKTY